MGMASLSFKYVLASDMGTYVCCVTTEHGEAQSQPAELIVETTKNLDTETQLKAPNGKLLIKEVLSRLLEWLKIIEATCYPNGVDFLAIRIMRFYFK